MSEIKGQKETLLQLVRDAIRRDNELRDEFKVGDKFRFIRDRLLALQARLEESLATLQKETETKEIVIAEDEIVVHVYLFNALGINVQTWKKMVSPSVFYEYSVNRPIYAEKAHIDSFIRSKTTKVQHAYLSFAVKKVDILSVAEVMKDTIGNPLLKVKEGAFKPKRVISFTHNEIVYKISDDGELVKLPQS